MAEVVTVRDQDDQIDEACGQLFAVLVPVAFVLAVAALLAMVGVLVWFGVAGVVYIARILW